MPIIHLHVASRARRFTEAAEHAAALLPSSLQGSGALALIYRGIEDPQQREPAVAAVRELLARLPTQTLVSSGMPTLLMEWFTELGRLDLAFEVANRALDSAAEMRLDERSPRAPRPMRAPVRSAPRPPNWQMLWLPELLPLRRDARFRALATRLGFVDYWRAHGPPDCPAAQAIVSRDPRGL